MSSEIVERLRVQHTKGIIDLPEDWEYVHYGDAASHIEALEAENSEMKRALSIFSSYGVSMIGQEGGRWIIGMPVTSPQPKFADFDLAKALSQAKE